MGNAIDADSPSPGVLPCAINPLLVASLLTPPLPSRGEGSGEGGNWQDNFSMRLYTVEYFYDLPVRAVALKSVSSIVRIARSASFQP
jgi:hypothetical protein